MGRTAYTLIQLQSMILPWMIPVVNTTVTYDVTAPVISATVPVTNGFTNSTKVSFTLALDPAHPAAAGALIIGPI